MTQEQVRDRMLGRLPDHYGTSQRMSEIMHAFAEEIRVIELFSQTQSSQSDEELKEYTDNEIGYGYERLINQFYIIASNHLLDEFEEILDLRLPFPDPKNYIELRNRILFISRFFSANTYEDFVQEGQAISSTYSLVENISDYSIILIITVRDNALIPIIKDRIEKTIPAHIGGQIIFNVITIDDGYTIDDSKRIDEGTITNINRLDITVA